MESVIGVERQRVVDRLIREIVRCETQVIAHATRAAQRCGEIGPVLALAEVAKHAATLGVRFGTIVEAHDLSLGRSGFASTLASLRDVVARYRTDPERAFRGALLDLRHGLDVVTLAREVMHTEGIFGLIRWCDDWLPLRRVLVSRVEAHLAWFAAGADVPIPAPAPCEPPPRPGTMIALWPPRRDPDEASPASK